MREPYFVGSHYVVRYVNVVIQKGTRSYNRPNVGLSQASVWNYFFIFI
jgi:hypothetical protein